MSGPYGPNDPNQQWAADRQPEQGGQPAQGDQAPYGGYPGAGGYGPGQQPEGQPQWGAPPQQGQPPQGQPPYGQPPYGQQWGQQPPAPPYGQPGWGAAPGQPQPGQLGQPTQPGQLGQPTQPGQLGQPTQPGQLGQPTAPGWGGQPGWGQPGAQQWGQGGPGQGSPEQGPGSGNSKLPWIIGGAVLAVVVVAGIAIAAFSALGGTTTLDSDAAAAGVEKILTESYGATDVSGVSCPSGQEVKSGNSFTCDAQIDGESRSVTVTFTDDSGTYEVSRPS
ncbi:protein of unknown function [Rhodococcus triatomae]|uniref:DUF4333 domain-containing protein n=1 Tax=Rhodococcus triatomae TaxID=300028 RepID=A0A1G8P3P0_9NOCA|nr:DUF4333 domain-containing protein [Rhodococcus triatomae]SDI87104.1 protein of unknown function [Rhodococcus triatomae]